MKLPMNVLASAIGLALGLPLSPTHASMGGGVWTPAQWFLANEQGIWLDPSDFTRYMGELGPELVPNVDFSAGLSGWSDTSPGTYTVIGDRLLVGDNGGTAGIYRDFAVTPGATYLVRADVELTVSGGGLLKAYPGGGFVGELATATMVAGRATPSLVVKATTASIRVYLNEQTVTVGAGFYVASVSLRELTAINTATMFQDSAGTTPVTAVEQPVGLALDKRLGLVLGSEVVAMPYSGSASGAWAVSSTSVTRNGSAGGQATVSLVGGASLPTTTRYRVTFRVSGLSGDTIGVRIGGGTAYNVTANGTYTWTVAGGGGTSFTVIPWGGVAGEAIIENISVRELPGNHTYQPTTAQKPVLSARKNLLTYTEDFSNAVWTKANSAATADTITVNNSGGTGVAGITRNMTITAGTHVFSVELKANTLTWAAIATSAFTGATLVGSAYFDLANGVLGATNQTEATITAVGDGWYRCTAKITPDAGDVFGNFAIYLADGDNDITVNLNGTGSIYARKASLVPLSDTSWPYQRVTTATDYDTVGFPHYLKFDGVDDNLVTGNIDFTATDKMTVMAAAERVLNTAGRKAIVYGGSGDPNNTNGSFALSSPNDGSDAVVQVRGTQQSAQNFPLVAPKNVLSAEYNLAGGSYVTNTKLRQNGTQLVGTAGGNSTTGGGTFGAGALAVGTLPAGGKFGGNIYQLLVRGAYTADLTPGETFFATKL